MKDRFTIRQARGGGAIRVRGGAGGAILAAAWIIAGLALIALVLWIRMQDDPALAGRKVVLSLPPVAADRTEDLMPPSRAASEPAATVPSEAGATPAEPATPAPAPAAAPASGPAEPIGGVPLPTTTGPNGQMVLAPAPDPSLTADSPNGPLPVIDSAGRRAWRAYARPFAAAADLPRLAIVIEGLGLSDTVTTAAIDLLPGEVTLSFVPYARDLPALVARARAAGHEVLIELPMEPYDYPQNDPGPSTLLTGATPAENITRLEWLLARAPGYVGAMNYLGAKFTASADSLQPILQALNARGLMFFDSHAFGTSTTRDVARTVGIPFASSDLAIDGRRLRADIDGQLGKLAQAAQQAGHAIGVGGAYPVTIERVAVWAAGPGGKTVALAPLSALAAPVAATPPAVAAPAVTTPATEVQDGR